jgi:hypothetical protein
MGDLINQILNELKALNTFQFVTIWNNQFNFMEDGASYSIPFPNAFVEVNTDNTEDISMNYQASDIEIKIHIGQDFYNGSNIDENFSIFDLRDLIVAKLSSFKTTTSGIFRKINETQDFEHSNVYHYVITFKTHWVDSTAVSQQYYTTTTPKLIINN